MGAARSIPPPPRSEPRTLRGDTVPKTLALKSPLRSSARLAGAQALDEACTRAALSSNELAKDMGLRSDREGDEARSGALVVSAGEAILLPPASVAIPAAIDLITKKRARDRGALIRLTPEQVETLRGLLLEHALHAS